VRLAKISLSKATDADLAALQDLKLDTVEHLLLADCPVTDDGLKCINSRAFPNLRRLRLDYTQISDAGLAQLNDLPKLESLYVSYTQVSNAGVHHLSNMKGLRVLDLTATKVDANGRDELRKKLPGLTIMSP
jgi:hypothetical protein